jgi:hypothetical protein
MTITYDFSADDLVRFQQSLLDQVMKDPRYFFKRVLISLIFGIATGAMLARLGKTDNGLLTDGELISALIIGVVILVATFLVYPRITRNDVRQQMQKDIRRGKYQGLIGHHTVSLDPEYYAHTTAESEMRIRWSAIKEITSLPGYTYVSFGPDSGDIIPHRIFRDSTECTTFEQRIRAYAGRAQNTRA